MRATTVVCGIFAVAGWSAAAWLFVSKPQPPIVIASNSGASDSVAKAEPKSGPELAPEPVVPVQKSSVEIAFYEWSSDPQLAGALIGFCLLDENGSPVYASPLASTALCPASALKTVTTAAALELLGPEFRFATSLVSEAAISSSGVLDGNLKLVSDGDPTLATEDLEALAGLVIKAGLKQVNGKLVIQGADFREPPVNDHWNWGDIGNAYGAGAFGLNLDHNRLTLRFQPAAVEGQPAKLLNPDGATKDTKWINEVVTGPAGTGDRVVIYSQPTGRTITLRGSVPLGEDPFAVTGALPDPPAKVKEILQAKLEAAGVKFLGRKIPEKSAAAVLAEHKSELLPEIIDHLHKVSDNLEAQCLFQTIGLRKPTDPDPASTVRSYWEGRGAGFKGLRLIDGSGLARANMIRPLDLAKVNYLARRGPYGERFRQSLIAYVDGKVRAKLGAMSGVKTDVGFITMADGREFTFCLMANGLNTQLSYWPLRDNLLRQVATGSGR